MDLPLSFKNPLVSYFPLDKYPGGPRDLQREAFRFVEDSMRFPSFRFFELEAPVGTGKSLVVYTLAKAFEAVGMSSVIITPMKVLQQDYNERFPDIPNLMGRANYKCPLDAGEGRFPLTAADAPCSATGKACQKYRDRQTTCGYYDTRNAAVANYTMAVNFDYFLRAQKICRIRKTKLDEAFGADSNSGTMRRVLLIDEAHTAVESMQRVIDIEITDIWLQRYSIDVRHMISRNKEIKTAKKLVAEGVITGHLLGDITNDIDDLKPTVDALGKKNSLSETDKSKLREYNRLVSLKASVETLLQTVKDGSVDWVVKAEDANGRQASNENYVKRVRFQPTKMDYFAETRLFNQFSRVIMLSSTFLGSRNFSEELGIRQNHGVSYMALPNPFELRRRPIFFCEGSPDMTASRFYNQPAAKQQAFANSAAKIAEIARVNSGFKGIVFTVSRDRQQELLRLLGQNYPDVASRCLDAYSDNKDEMLKQHKASPEPTILFTDSMYQGIDLAHDASRFQIFVKVYYPAQGEREQLLKAENPAWFSNWYAIQTGRRMVQAYGRSTRAPDDWATTYVIDAAWHGFLRNCSAHLPKWFMAAIKTINKIVPADHELNSVQV